MGHICNLSYMMSFRNFKQSLVVVSFVLFLYIPTILVFYFAWSKDFVPLEGFESIRFLVLLLFAPIILKYFIQLLIAPFYSVVEHARSIRRQENFFPSVSVIIPAWNEEVGIMKTIKSVLNTKYPKMELVVVNDGSTDNTHKTVTDFLNKCQKENLYSGVQIRYLKIKNGGKARALNKALEVAVNEIVMTVDADSIMDKNAIKNIVKHFADMRVASVAGNVVIGNRSNPICLIQQLEYLYGFYFKRADSLFNAVYIVGGAAAAYRKSVFAEIGNFDVNMITEDIEISTRLQAFGYHVRYASDAYVFTEGPSDFMSLCKQRLRWKLGRLLTFWKHRSLFFSLRKTHKSYLSFLILPIALFAELLLLCEGILLIIFYTYTFYTNDFVPLAFVITLLTGVIVLQIISDPKVKFHRNLVLLAPTAWLLFYFMDLVEYQALLKSIKKIVTKSELRWQKWNRMGVFLDAQENA
ncbi:MAG: glycosyltransferase family 2 protein [Candidatus Ryanbacteria bacterium CG10_big_fil_rev_8_21_14_0_10_43_42]|uniref:Glycosyltransferase family 2 protein n=1 Tax=Candidatus Ryanbacteria bacterium CG10_big_fil_rev_8_21_14_0_10_43_42 TaxID=1974864 RepID=A0A2M8KXT8_9BACT|nr:MAG: glycosyltransferase family 2 protein [Candidatus Ryanbacteria bacterium CG10_big_fil_rev_8_21_14_0_10_43_42]